MCHPEIIESKQTEFVTYLTGLRQSVVGGVGKEADGMLEEGLGIEYGIIVSYA